MDDKFDNYPFVREQYAPTTTPENVANSPLSGDDTTVTRKRRGSGKRVVTVKMGGVHGSRIKGEVYPPSDSWAWRKYGQKPIKGSPYPRGYYRCSSSKGCPAKKQVERSHVDPTTVVITYACDHNHPIPSSTTTTAAKHLNAAVPAKFPPEELAAFANQPDLEPDNNNNEFAEFTGECGWLPDASFAVLETPVTVGTTCADADVELGITMGEEDQSLFADLGELPECSLVFGRRADHRAGSCNLGTLSCGSTG